MAILPHRIFVTLFPFISFVCLQHGSGITQAGRKLDNVFWHHGKVESILIRLPGTVRTSVVARNMDPPASSLDAMKGRLVDDPTVWPSIPGTSKGTSWPNCLGEVRL